MISMLIVTLLPNYHKIVYNIYDYGLWIIDLLGIWKVTFIFYKFSLVY